MLIAADMRPRSATIAGAPNVEPNALKLALPQTVERLAASNAAFTPERCDAHGAEWHGPIVRK